MKNVSIEKVTNGWLVSWCDNGFKKYVFTTKEDMINFFAEIL